MKIKTKIITVAMALSLAGSITGMENTLAVKNAKVRLSQKQVTCVVGKCTTITLNNASKNVKWSVSNNKNVKITKKTGTYQNKITIKGKKAGTANIVAKYGKKKYKVVLTITEKKEKVQDTTEAPKAAVYSTEATTTEPRTSSAAATTQKAHPVVDNTDKTTSTTEKQTTESPADVEDTNKIIATARKSTITSKEDLVIDLSVVGDNERAYYYDLTLGKLEYNENGNWKTIQNKSGVKIPALACELSTKYGNSITVSLLENYGELQAGHYRYTKDITNEKSVMVEFAIQ